MAAVTITANPSHLTMSGSTLAAAAPSILPPHQHRGSFSAAPPALGPPQLPTSTSNSSFDGKNLKMSQSQASSQQSFSMSQPSSQQLHRFIDSGSLRTGPSGNPNMDVPQIYSAVYSGVDVYEMEVNGVAVMRRRHDSCLNATQILKVANIDKGKRTKILEKEIQTGDHEKVQGGYGKYQGTWIKFDRGVEVCRQYGVEELLRPLLTYDMGQDGGIAGQGDFNTPTKEQAMAAQRKRMYSANNAEGRTHGPSGTFFKNISSTASNAVAAISKARFDSPGPRGRNGPSRPPGLSRQSSMQNIDDFPGNSQQSFTSDFGHNDSAYSTQTTQIFGDEPARKRQRVFTPADSFGGYNSQSMDMYANEFPGSPTEPNASFMYSQVNMDNQNDSMPLVPLPFDLSPDAERKRNQLMSLFLDNNGNQPYHDILQSMSPLDLDSPIDASSHTALHWAATLARIPLLKALIASGANPYRVNSSGETALMRASAVTNNSDQVSFPELLDVLGSTIDIRDNRGRTVLHHIAVTSAVKGRSHSSRYYLESLLEWVVRQGGVASSQEGNSPKMGIGRFMSEIVNAQDKSGDTALNIAARIGNRSIVAQLIEIEADPTIANKAGLRPVDFGVGTDATTNERNGDVTPTAADKTAPAGTNQKSRESGDEIISSITHLLNETTSGFQTELKKKQKDLDALHASLRMTSTEMGESRRTLESLQARSKAQSLGRQKTMNLTRGLEEEQKRLSRLEQNLPGLNTSNEWEVKVTSALDEVAKGANASTVSSSLPAAGILRARVQALKQRNEATKKSVSQLRARSKDIEMKYKQLVALCTSIQEADVDAVVDSLLRAVESEKGDLEIGRVRRFLGGVDGVVG